MEIVHIASECAPFAKVGGLGDVSAALAKAEGKLGTTITLVLPKYDTIELEGLQRLDQTYAVEELGEAIPVTIWKKELDSYTLLLIDPAHPKGYFNRGKIYCEPDDMQRFLFFAKAATRLIEELGMKPDAVHLHDWHAAACTLFLPEETSTVLTIHNLFHQGICLPNLLEALGATYEEKTWQDVSDGNYVNLLKGGILVANHVTTVSPSYAEEVQTPAEGMGLDKTLTSIGDRFRGILNGLDTEYWNPETDPHLPQPFDKATTKQEVQKELSLSVNSSPLVVAITRFVAQKGPDLIAYGIEKTVELGGQFVLLASNPDDESLPLFNELQELYEDHPSVRLLSGYNESLSHRLFAASDLFLIPSIFEPCGLTQMIAMRYGSLPIVRKTGGLKDTVFDDKNGFTFLAPDNRGVGSALETAFSVYEGDDEKWRALMEGAKGGDYAWEKSAKAYLDLLG